MRTPLLWGLYWALALGNVILQATQQPFRAGIIQIFLAPTLIIIVVASGLPSSWIRNWTLAALTFAFVGDTLPKLVPSNYELLAMLGGFLIAQVCWIIGLWLLRGRSLVVTARWQLPIYLIIAVVVLGTCVQDAGALVPGVIAYGVVVLTMGILASGLGRLGQFGGIIFLISDGLIALDRFAPWLHLPYPGVLIMATYTVALGCIVYATVQFLRKNSAPSGSKPV